MTVPEILNALEQLADPAAVEGMARVGIVWEQAFGVKIPRLRALAKQLGRDHDLAENLWAINCRETRLLATMVGDPKLVTEEQMERWAAEFNGWEVVDGCCNNLFKKSPLAWEKAIEWASRDGEFVKRAGFVLMATLAVGNKSVSDSRYEALLPLIAREATDPRNFVKKAVNWALRQIGKRNLALNRRAVEAARDVAKLDSPAARWIASDALRELESDAVQQRLRQKTGG